MRGRATSLAPSWMTEHGYKHFLGASSLMGSAVPDAMMTPHRSPAPTSPGRYCFAGAANRRGDLCARRDMIRISKTLNYTYRTARWAAFKVCPM
jgi:hypothetical protein